MMKPLVQFSEVIFVLLISLGVFLRKNMTSVHRSLFVTMILMVVLPLPRKLELAFKGENFNF